MNSICTAAAASSSSPSRPMDDIDIHSPLRPRRNEVARSFSSPTSILEKDQCNSLNKMYHRHLVSNKKNKNACSLFDLLEAGWEDKTSVKKRYNTDFLGSNIKNKQLAFALTKSKFWSEIEDLTSDIDSKEDSSSKECAVVTNIPPPPPSPATVEEQLEHEEEEEEEEDSLEEAVVDDLLDLALDCDFQDSFNLDSCRAKRRCPRDGRHYSFSDMVGEQQDHLLMLDEVSLCASLTSDYDDDDEISISQEEDVQLQRFVSSFAEQDTLCDIDTSHAEDDELSLDNTTLQSDKDYDDVHIDEDENENDDDAEYAISMSNLVVDVAVDADFGSRDSVNIKRCHRAQQRNNRNRHQIKSRISTL